MGSSVGSQYGITQTRGFEGSAQKPAVRFNIKPATKRKMFSHFRLNEASSFHHPTIAPSDFPTVFPHALTPSTSANATSSTGRLVKAARLRPLS